jgi:hypothetical protein
VSASVFILGGGDVGLRIADGLLRQGGIARLTVADVDAGRVGPSVDMLDCCHQAMVQFEHLDGTELKALERALRSAQPDLIVQASSLISPWSIIGRDHPTAKALNSAGIAVQLPAHLPIVLNLMRVVRDIGLEAPVANVSMPDIIHPILATQGLAPSIGLGNVSIVLLRALAAQKHRHPELEIGDRPLIRMVGHHKHVYGVMQAAPPKGTEDRARVYVGEEGRRDDRLAYEGTPVPVGPIYNVITAASALPILAALLPGSDPLRFSAPAPDGLPGGYPVRVEGRHVSFDLPEGVDLDEAVAFNRRMSTADGLAEITSTGEVTFTQQAEAAVRDIDPRLAEPFDPWRGTDRTNQLIEIIRAMR